MSSALAAPLDVKAMNVAASLLLWAVAALGLTVGIWWMLRLPVFSIASIRVEGEVMHNNAVTLRANVVHRLTGNFFTLDLASARHAFEAVPWVRRARLHREFPDRLVVQLQEHQPVAFWGKEEDGRMVNRHGEVFEANPDDLESDDLPRLSGPQGRSDAVLALYRALVPIFGTIDATIEALDLSDRGSWRAQLDSGATVELGRGDDAEVLERVNRFVRTAGQSAARYGRSTEAIESADLRHPNGYALRMRGVSTVTADAVKPHKPAVPVRKTDRQDRDR